MRCYFPRSVSVWVSLMAIAIPLAGAHAQGFDDSYEVSVGDLNGDGRSDLYIKRPRRLIGFVGTQPAIPIMESAEVPDFVLQSDGGESFTIIASLSGPQLDQVKRWPAAGVELTFRDVDVDGRVDLETFGMAGALPGAVDQIVYAEAPRQPPTRLTPLNAKFQRYHADLTQWTLNPNYFTQSDFKRVTGAEPARRLWFGSVTSASNLSLVALVANLCSQASPNNECAVSSRPPSPCVRSVNLLGPNGEVIGSDVRDVCGDPLHVYVYVPGELRFVVDQSATDADARGTAEILEHFRQTCSPLNLDAENRIGQALRFIFGPGLRPLSNLTQNSIKHPAYPGDELFDPQGPTFHHYDVRTQVCNTGDLNCNVGVISNFLLRRFSYPSFQLRPVVTQVDNVETRIAFITAPLLTEKPLSYVLPAGPIRQRRLLSGYAEGAIQNITERNHLVFPGLIARKIFTNKKGLEVFTHGVGLNQAFCIPRVPGSPTNILIAYFNDRFGPKAFKQLDREMVKFYQTFMTVGAPPADPPPANATVSLPVAARTPQSSLDPRQGGD